MNQRVDTHQEFWKKVKPLVFKVIIGSIVAAALIGVVAVIFGSFNELSLTLIFVIIIIITFSLLSWYDADVSSKRSHTFAIVGVLVSVYLLLLGIIKVTVPQLVNAMYTPVDSSSYINDFYSFSPIVDGFLQWIALVIIARFALLHAHLLLNIHRLYATPLLQLVAKGTIFFIFLLAVLFSAPSIFTEIDYTESYWRFTGAVLILNLLGTILIPISNALFNPKRAYDTQKSVPVTSSAWKAPTPPAEPGAAAPALPVVSAHAPRPVETKGQVIFDSPVAKDRRLAWPRYADGTPLPANADGTPNFTEVIRY